MMSCLKGRIACKCMVLFFGSFHVFEGGGNEAFHGEQELWENMMPYGKVVGGRLRKVRCPMKMKK